MKKHLILSVLIALAVICGAQTPCWDGSVASSYAGGNGTLENPYQIATAEQLALLAEQTNNGTGGNKHYILIDDICLDGDNQWIPIGQDLSSHCFTGVFDGNEHVIQGMYMNYDDMYNVGLFGSANGAEMKNITINDANINCNNVQGIGIIVGVIKNTTISHCTVDGSIQCNINQMNPMTAAGIVGSISDNEDSSDIRNCNNYAQVEGLDSAGGIVGSVSNNYGHVLIEECRNYGEIYGLKSASHVGGIIGDDDGYSDILIYNCLNNASVDSYNSGCSGGIVGYASKGNIINCFNYGNIQGMSAGGIIGSTSLMEICCCGNLGDIIGEQEMHSITRIGGISGSKGFISDCYNRGNISLSSISDGYSDYVYVGGIAGSISSLSISNYIQNSYNTGSINLFQYPNAALCGIIAGSAKNLDEFINCYWLGEYEFSACGDINNLGGTDDLPGSCAFNQDPTNGTWVLDVAQHGTTDMLIALNRGSSDNCYWVDDEGGYPTTVYSESDFPQLYSEWYYEINNLNGTITYQYLECAADTTIDNKRAKVIIKSNTLYDKDLVTKITHEYVYSEEGMVYWWDKQSASYTTLYNFDANAGDEWTIRVGNQSITMHVDAVDDNYYDGRNYRVLTVSDADGIFSGEIICGIGHTTSFFPEKLLNSNTDYSVEGMRCYWIDGEELLHFGEVDCNEVYGEYHDVEENAAMEFSVYPNPANDILIIKSDAVETCHGASQQEYTITNITGQIMMRGTISSDNQQVDVSNLENGMYFIKVGEKSMKFIKM